MKSCVSLVNVQNQIISSNPRLEANSVAYTCLMQTIGLFQSSDLEVRARYHLPQECPLKEARGLRFYTSHTREYAASRHCIATS